MSLFSKLKVIPDPPEIIEGDPNPGVQYVVYTHRSRLNEIAAVVGEVGGRTVVPPQKLPEGPEWYQTVLVPFGNIKLFKDRIWEEALNIVEED